MGGVETLIGYASIILLLLGIYLAKTRLKSNFIAGYLFAWVVSLLLSMLYK